MEAIKQSVITIPEGSQMLDIGFDDDWCEALCGLPYEELGMMALDIVQKAPVTFGNLIIADGSKMGS